MSVTIITKNIKRKYENGHVLSSKNSAKTTGLVENLIDGGDKEATAPSTFYNS